MVVMLLGSSMYAYSLNYLMTYLNSRYGATLVVGCWLVVLACLPAPASYVTYSS